MEAARRAIDFSLGEPGYSPPPHAAAAAMAALQSQPLGYAPPGGLPALREMIARTLREKHGYPIDPSHILITAGASMGLYAALAALLKPGDVVMCPDPGYPPYAALVKRLGGIPRYYPFSYTNGVQHDIALLEAALSASARIVLWNSPANPTGSVASAAVTRELLALVARRDLWLLSDEAYAELTYEEPHYSPLSCGQTDRLVSIASFSKSYALSGWRVGYMLLPPALYPLAQMAHWTAAMSPSTLSQYAALGALHTPAAYLESLRGQLRARRDLAVRGLTAYGIPVSSPQGAFFLWLDSASMGYTARQFCQLCWEHSRVALSPGSSFGPAGEGYVRLCFARPEDELWEGVQRLGLLYQALSAQRGRQHSANTNG